MSKRTATISCRIPIETRIHLETIANEYKYLSLSDVILILLDEGIANRLKINPKNFEKALTQNQN